MNAKELHYWFTGPSPVSGMDAEDKQTILRALSLLAAAEANDGATPETDAFLENALSAIHETETIEDFTRQLERDLAAERKRSDALIGALEQFANNNLSEANCGSVELAGRRVANIARVALDTARRK